jgi:hypothetical protein
MRGCFKVGCVGCLVVAGLAVACAIALGAIVAVSARREARPEAVGARHDPPGPFGLRGDGASGPSGEAPPVAAGDPRLAEPGRIRLDVAMCQFTLEPGSPGEPLRLDGRYDDAALDVKESWGSYGEIGWTYDVEIRKPGLPFFVNQDAEDCRMTLTIPADVPFVLEGRVGIGESKLDLGGLHVLQVDLEAGIGSHEVSFDRPTAAPLDHVRIHGSIGELRVEQLGNASPAEAEITHTLGEVRVDLEGQWSRDAAVDVRCGLGSCGVRLPDDVGIELGSISIGIGESNLSELEGREPRPGMPTLKLSLAGKMGEVRVE